MALVDVTALIGAGGTAPSGPATSLDDAIGKIKTAYPYLKTWTYASVSALTWIDWTNILLTQGVDTYQVAVHLRYLLEMQYRLGTT